MGRQIQQVSTPSLTFDPAVTAQGDGSYLIRAGKPIAKLSIKAAAKIAGVSRSTIYRLYDCGLLKGERVSPRKIVITAASLQEHLTNARDGEDWQQPERRQRYRSVC